MAIWQAESKRKPTGGRRIPAHKKRKFEIGREAQPATLGQPKRKTVRTRGGHPRVRIITANSVVVTDPKTGKAKRAEIVPPGVVTNAANPHYVRRNIITKGAVVKTTLGLARITSRPGQDGTLNAVLVEAAK
ncbi:MAG TPA: 30S ribosomal protein S8e [Candidatus Thermoplasmatota archaeon]|jgi:small subunit ribosomal protein S8e|nr:30S ribosomal protein S8e [Candidatus Thermoplasmatota archaeon]